MRWFGFFAFVFSTLTYSGEGSAAVPIDCTPEAPCESGAGHCDVDEDCLAGLRCAPTGLRFGYEDGVQVCQALDCFEVGNGDRTYCRPDCPCVEGEGDCDGHDECAGDLICAANRGAEFGMPAGYDICSVVECVRGAGAGDPDACSATCRCDEGVGHCTSDAGCEGDLKCTGNGAAYGYADGVQVCESICVRGQAAGEPDVCTDRCKCSVGRGHCVTDNDCEEGLVCLPEGVRFGYSADIAVCMPATCFQHRFGDKDFCSAECPCMDGEGDCDGHDHCAGDLLCHSNRGADVGLPVGHDVCGPAVCERGEAGAPHACGPLCKCAEGEGHCENDIDCAPAMACTGLGPDYGYAEGVKVCRLACIRGAEPGDPDVCTPECPCQAGHGHCETDDDCDTGLQCRDTGERFGFAPGVKVCQSADCYALGLGDRSFCTLTCPCLEGEGDCDQHNNCVGDLICADNRGAEFGMPSGHDICVWASCAVGQAPGEPDGCSRSCRCDHGRGHCETDADCEPDTSCQNEGPAFGFAPEVNVCVSLQCVRGGAPGEPDECSDLCPCTEGRGHCGADTHCAPGLLCAPNGTRYGYSADVSVCQPAHCFLEGNGGRSFCSAECPCLDGEGDCDRHDHCAGDLICDSNRGAEFGMPSGHDICAQAACLLGQAPGEPDACSPTCPCAEGHGDCKVDADCTGDLVCNRDGPDFGYAEGVKVCGVSDCVIGAGPGDPDVCTPECRCRAGHGHCEADADCKPGLVCAATGERYGYAADIRVCQPEACFTDGNGTLSFCSDECPCLEGEGDCDRHTQCATGFICHSNLGADFGMPSGYDICGPSTCEQDGVPGVPDVCSPMCKCPETRGHCVNDRDCSGGLVCRPSAGSFDYAISVNVCVAPDWVPEGKAAPTTTALDAFRVDAQTLRLWVRGHDEDGDAVGLSFELLDAQGAPIDGDGDGTPDTFEVTFNPPVTGQIDFDTLVDFPGVLDAATVQVQLTLVDETRLEAAAVIANIVDLPLQADGEPCDPNGMLNICAPNSVCTPEGEGAFTCSAVAGYSCDVVVDVNLLGEKIDQTTTYVGDGTYNVNTTGGSCGGAGMDVSHQYMPSQRADLIISTDDDPTDFDTVLYVRTGCADAESELGCNDDLPDAPPRSGLEIVDAPQQPLFIYVDGKDAANRGRYALVIRERPIVGLFEPCDLPGQITRCDTDLTCFGDVNPTCLASLPPIITAADAVVTPEGELRVFIAGTDVDGDVTHVEVALLDDQGVGIDFDNDGNPDRPVLSLDPDPTGLLEFDLVAVMDVQGIANLAALRIELLDAADNHSRPFDLAPVALPILPLDAPCDIRKLRDRCGPRLLCVSQEVGAVCGPIPGYDCDQLADLNLDATVEPDGRYAYLGDSLLTLAQHEGSCGGAGVEVIHRFVMPFRGKAVLTIDHAESDYDLAMYVRTSCAEPETEMSCESEGNVVRNASVYLDEMAAGTELLIFVDALEPEARGTYTLRLRAQPIRLLNELCDPTAQADLCDEGLLCIRDEVDPEIEATCLVVNPPVLNSADAFVHPDNRAGHIIIDGSDVEADVDGARVQGFNAAGDPVDIYEDPANPGGNSLLPAGLRSASPPGAKAAPLGRHFEFDRTVLFKETFVERITLGTIANPDVASLSVVLLDTAGLASNVLMVPLEMLPLYGQGEACDSTGFRDGCETGLSCAPTESGSICAALGGFSCDAPIDINEVASIVNGDWFYTDTNAGREPTTAGSCRRERSGPDIYFVFTVPENGRVTATTLSPETTFDTVMYARSVCDDPESELMCSDDMENAFGPSEVIVDALAGDVLYFILDAFSASGAQSVGRYGLTVSMYPIRTEKQGCDPTGEESACVPGLACSDNGAGGFTCQEHFPPAINTVEAYRIDDNVLRIVVDGTDAGGNVRSLRATVFDDAGGSYKLGGNFNDDLRGQMSFVAPADISGVNGRSAVSVEVRIRDGMGVYSGTTVADVVPFPRPGPSEPCDPIALRDRCIDNHLCEVVSRNQWGCVPVRGTMCDAPFFLNFDATRAGDTWTYQGTTSNGGNGIDGTCAGQAGGLEVFHQITVFIDSLVVVTTEQPETTIDTVLYMFDQCGGAELACNDDTDTTRSTLDLGMVPGRTDLSLIVDSIGASGTYGLEVQVVPDPTWPTIVINEVYYDEPGADGDEQFTELFGPAGMALDGWTLAGVNLGTQSSPRLEDKEIIPLDGLVIPEDGFLVIAVNENIAGPVHLVADVDWQNGPDAVQLRDPAGRVIDAVQYGERGYVLAGEGLPTGSARSGRSLSRDANHTDTHDNLTDFTVETTPTPGANPVLAP